ncbi:unnamed protein product, partial [Closterium sp. NIES-53]
FSEADAQEVKRVEATTNHDVKAVEYFLKARFQDHPELSPILEFFHFACTSEDINNLSHGLMLSAAVKDEVLPAMDGVIATLRGMAHKYAEQPMLSRTHGQQTGVKDEVLPAMDGVIATLKGMAHMYAEQPMLSRTHGQTRQQAGVKDEVLPAMDGVIATLKGMAHMYAEQPMLSRTHGQDEVLPAMDGLIATLRGMAHTYADQPMLSRTHGQVMTAHEAEYLGR